MAKDFKVSFPVALVSQASTMSCWYACTQMLLRYHGITSVRSLLVDNRFTTSALSILDRGLNTTKVKEYAETVGLRTSTFKPTPKALAHALTAYGPLMYGGTVPASNYGGATAHMVVITGIEYTASLGEDWVMYNDPFPVGVGKQTDCELKDFFTKEIADMGTPFIHK